MRGLKYQEFVAFIINQLIIDYSTLISDPLEHMDEDLVHFGLQKHQNIFRFEHQVFYEKATDYDFNSEYFEETPIREVIKSYIVEDVINKTN